MATRNIILELAHSRRLEEFVTGAMGDSSVELDTDLTPDFDNFQYDVSFSGMSLPQIADDPATHPDDDLFDPLSSFAVDESPSASTYLMRGSVEEGNMEAFEAEVARKRSVVGYYADVTIENFQVCPNSPPVGTDQTVEKLLHTARLHRCNMDGTGVTVAIVDTGINLRYLNSRGKNPSIDPARSWSWNPAVVTPFKASVGHGTMVAYDVCIAAPKCTLLDIALLRPLSAPPGGSLMQGLLSDAIRAYRHLLTVMNQPRRPGENRSLVVNNSWGMFHPSWDFPVDHDGNYSDNPNHPFTRIVATLERAGADILFAAGNCGAPCPDWRCRGVTVRTIYGANSSSHVLTVAGVDTNNVRAGYSSTGPGRLDKRKPDISGYTHFKGSGVYSSDGGTSAATPVVAGVVAAIRTKRPFNPANSSTRPTAIRHLLTSTATDLGPTGFDFLHGYGVVNGYAIYKKLCQPILLPPPPLCKRYPWLCRQYLCRRYPWLCDPDWWRKIEKQPPQSESVEASASATGEIQTNGGAAMDLAALENYPVAAEDELTLEEMAFLASVLMTETVSSSPEKSSTSGDCGCQK